MNSIIPARIFNVLHRFEMRNYANILFGITYPTATAEKKMRTDCDTWERGVLDEASTVAPPEKQTHTHNFQNGELKNSIGMMGAAKLEHKQPQYTENTEHFPMQECHYLI